MLYYQWFLERTALKSCIGFQIMKICSIKGSLGLGVGMTVAFKPFLVDARVIVQAPLLGREWHISRMTHTMGFRSLTLFGGQSCLETFSRQGGIESTFSESINVLFYQTPF